jgi:hypothetical protein
MVNGATQHCLSDTYNAAGGEKLQKPPTGGPKTAGSWSTALLGIAFRIIPITPQETRRYKKELKFGGHFRRGACVMPAKSADLTASLTQKWQLVPGFQFSRSTMSLQPMLIMRYAPTRNTYLRIIDKGAVDRIT